MWMGTWGKQVTGKKEALYHRPPVLFEDSLSLQIGGASDISKGLKG